MAKAPIHLRKRRTRGHVIADLSVNHVERQALLCGYAVERLRMDYGIDLIVHTYNAKGEIENGRILFQVKATDRIRPAMDGRTISCRIDKADLLYWLGERIPVILVQYDAQSDVAWWFHVQFDLDDRQRVQLFSSGKDLTIAIPKANVLDRRALRAIARTKNAILSDMEKEGHHAD